MPPDTEHLIGAIGTVAAALITLFGTLLGLWLVQIGSWQARARRSIKADLEIIKDSDTINRLPIDSPVRKDLVGWVEQRTAAMVRRATTPGFHGWLSRQPVVSVFCGLILLAAVAVGVVAGIRTGLPAMRQALSDRPGLSTFLTLGAAIASIAGVAFGLLSTRRMERQADKAVATLEAFADEHRRRTALREYRRLIDERHPPSRYNPQC